MLTHTTFRNVLLGVLCLGIIAYLALAFFVYSQQTSMLFFPSPEPFEQCDGKDLKPVTVEYQGRTLRYAERRQANAVGWLIIFHGNAGRACDRAYYLDLLKNIPLNFAIVEYPGYSGDSGEMSQRNFLPYALAMTDYIRSLSAQTTESSATAPNSKPLPVFLLGESLGTGIATYVASERIEPGTIAGLILVAPYTSIADLGAAQIPWLPVRLLARNPFPASEWAPKVTAPVLILHGSDDNIIPVDYGRRQKANFRSNVRFEELTNAGHNDWFSRAGVQAARTIQDFIGLTLQISNVQ